MGKSHVKQGENNATKSNQVQGRTCLFRYEQASIQ
ncbi:MAG: hypothetical protein K0R66_1170 [Gammaproteobacteria bacterium]|jgi:hypothetical protein|nr:hypothetical protein [Gammaproteobacteria bacterium]